MGLKDVSFNGASCASQIDLRANAHQCARCNLRSNLFSMFGYLNKDDSTWNVCQDEALSRVVEQIKEIPWKQRATRRAVELVCFRCCGDAHKTNYVRVEGIEGKTMKLTSAFQNASKKSRPGAKVPQAKLAKALEAIQTGWKDKHAKVATGIRAVPVVWGKYKIAKM